MKQISRVLLIAVFMVLACHVSFAGDTVRTPGGGTMGTQQGGGGAILPMDAVNKLHEGEKSDLRVGFETVIPKAHFTDSFGRKIESKNLVHVLPCIEYVQVVGEGLVLFANIAAKDAQGFAFGKNPQQWGFDTQSLIARINVSVGVAYQIDDVWTLAFATDVGIVQLKLDYAFDLNRLYLPVLAKSMAYGVGVGVSGAVICQPNEKLRLGLQVCSPMKVFCKGRTGLLGGNLSDTWKADMEFPVSVHLAGSYQLTDRLGLAGDVNWYDFSGDINPTLKFNRWGFSKPLNLGFRPTIGIHGGINYKATDKLTLRCGAGWLTRGVKDGYVDTTTTDVPGYDVAAGLSYKASDSVDINLAYTHAGGVTHGKSLLPGILPREKYEVAIDTIAVDCTIKFGFGGHKRR